MAAALSKYSTAKPAGRLRKCAARIPQAALIDLAGFLDPPEKYFWDLGHVYDETNMVLAQRIYPDIRPLVERGLREVR